MTSSEIDIDSLCKTFEMRPPQDVLLWAYSTFGSRVSIMTSFQATGLVVLDMAQKLITGFPAFTLDTGFLFKETIDLKHRLEDRYGIEIESVDPLLSVERQAEVYGEALYRSQPDECCRMRKVEPLLRKLVDLDAWVTGVRRDQSETRANTRLLERHLDQDRSWIKINPLAGWNKKQVWDYILSHQIPYNPLHDQGYPSIGCVPCTRQVKPGEEERSGRWSSFDKTECGIHTFSTPLHQIEEG